MDANVSAKHAASIFRAEFHTTQKPTPTKILYVISTVIFFKKIHKIILSVETNKKITSFVHILFKIKTTDVRCMGQMRNELRSGLRPGYHARI